MSQDDYIRWFIMKEVIEELTLVVQIVSKLFAILYCFKNSSSLWGGFIQPRISRYQDSTHCEQRVIVHYSRNKLRYNTDFPDLTYFEDFTRVKFKCLQKHDDPTKTTDFKSLFEAVKCEGRHFICHFRNPQSNSLWGSWKIYYRYIRIHQSWY